MQADFCCCCSLIEWFVHAISKDTDFKSSYSIWNPSYYFTNWLKFNADKDILAAKLNLWFYRTYAITIVLTEDSKQYEWKGGHLPHLIQNRPYSDQASQSPHPKTFFDCFLFVRLFVLILLFSYVLFLDSNSIFYSYCIFYSCFCHSQSNHNLSLSPFFRLCRVPRMPSICTQSLRHHFNMISYYHRDLECICFSCFLYKLLS